MAQIRRGVLVVVGGLLVLAIMALAVTLAFLAYAANLSPEAEWAGLAIVCDGWLLAYVSAILWLGWRLWVRLRDATAPWGTVLLVAWSLLLALPAVVFTVLHVTKVLSEFG